MARIVEDGEIQGGPGEVVVERTVVPVRERHSWLATAIVVAFIVSCAVVFWTQTPPAPAVPDQAAQQAPAVTR